MNNTVRLAIPENHTLEPKIMTLSYTQPKLSPFKELFNFPRRRHCNFKKIFEAASFEPSRAKMCWEVW